MNKPTVYIGFCTGTGWLSRIIEWFSKGPSHAFLLYYDDEFGGWLQLGEEIGGWVQMAGEYISNVTSLYELPEVDIWAGLRANRTWLGSGYDFGGLLGMSWVSIAYYWFKMKVKNPLSSKTNWYCSGIIQKVISESPGGENFKLDPATTSPRFLEDEIKKFGAIPRDYAVVTKGLEKLTA